MEAWAQDDAEAYADPHPAPDRWDEAFGDPDYVPTAGALLAQACGLEPGSGQLSSLVGVDVSTLSADDAVTALQEMQRFVAYAAGMETRLRAEVTDVVLAHVEGQFAAEAERERLANAERAAAGLATLPSRPQYVCPEQVAYAEVAAALRLSPRTGESRILASQELTGAWRALLDAMLAGDLTADYAGAIGRELRHIPGYGSVEPATVIAYGKACAKVLAVVVPFARTHTPGEAARKTRVLVTALDPAGARNRRRKTAEQQHGVYVNPLEPGTSEFRAVLPTAYAEAMHVAVRTLAKDPRFEVADGCVTAGQRQAAALVALTLGDPGSVARVEGPVQEAKLAVHVNVLVPIESLVGAGEQGGRVGNVPVPADEIRDLIAHAALESSTIRRLVTEATGCILDAGRKRYLASDLQKLVIRLRDGYCRFPGCNDPAWRGEIDHAKPYDAGGSSDLDNFGVLCKFHHQLKTHANWVIIQSARDGSCTWRSPLGRIYQHTPPDLVPPPPTPVEHDPPPF